MTLLLAMEAIDAGSLTLEETVTASPRAASMGGSQIWLEAGEQMSVGETIKCITVVSANDCCVALAEHMAGSEEAFVARMNARAAELGLTDTHFTSCSGLSDSGDHYSCAHDLAVISRELISHEGIKTYSTIWMDSIRNGAFGLSNTNKLIYYYEGATGLKTGFTSAAMYCLAATAERDGTEYIAVVLHAPTSAERFADARTLLSYGFANYTLVSPENLAVLPPVPVSMGRADCVTPVLPEGGGILLEKSAAVSLRAEPELPDSLSAPVEEGQTIGSLKICLGEEEIQRIPLLAGESVPRLGLGEKFLWLLRALVS